MLDNTTVRELGFTVLPYGPGLAWTIAIPPEGHSGALRIHPHYLTNHGVTAERAGQGADGTSSGGCPFI